MEKIKLYNRYNEDNYLQHIEDDKWQLVLGNEKDNNYVCIIGQEGEHEIDHNNLYAIDPPGGPFINVGSKIAGKEVYKITAIAPGFQIYLKDETE